MLNFAAEILNYCTMESDTRVKILEQMVDILKEEIKELTAIIKLFAAKSEDINIVNDVKNGTQNSYNNTGKVGDSHENDVDIKK